MAIVQGRTRAELRQSVGENLNAIRTGTAYDAGSTTTLISLILVGADDNYNGKWVVVKDSSSTTSEIRIVSDYTASAKRLTLQQALSFSTVAGDTFELWDDIYRPDMINSFLNMGILDVTGLFFDPVENLSLHTDGATQRFDVPSGLSMVQHILYRSAVSSTRLHACGSTFDETEDASFTQELDTKDKKQGTQSLKLTISASAEADDVIADSIASTNISGYDYVEFWIKSTVGTNAGDLKIHLDSTTITEATANASETDEALSVPALTADKWTFCRVQLANPESDTAITSIALEYHTDLGACTVWLDDISAVKNDTAQWNEIPRHLWKTDRGASDIILDSDVHGVARYNLLKIIGGDKPALMTSDSDTSEVPEFYLIARACELAFAATSGGPQTDYDGHNNMAGYWSIQASRAKRAIPMLTNVRLVA